MVYRPTVRYADVFKAYVDGLFKATTLDRNQIIRAALFTSIFSGEFQKLIAAYKRKDVPLPSPLWSLNQSELWMEQNPNTEGGRDVDANNVSQTEENGREEQAIWGQEKTQERGKAAQSKNEKLGSQGKRREKKEKALDTRAQERPIRKVHGNGGITIRIG